jgi:hypothetical protein
LVVAVNVHRFTSNNHRALVAGAISIAAHIPGRELVSLCGVSSVGSMIRAKVVVRSGTDRLKALTAAGLVPLTTGARIANLPLEAQDTFCERIEAGGHPRFVGRPGWTGGDDPAGPDAHQLSKREARYRYVQESALQVMANSLDGLAIVLASADGGLHPAITPEQAAHWRRDLSRQMKSIRRLMALLSERSAARSVTE